MKSGHIYMDQKHI